MQNITIVLLLVTAAILSAVLITSYATKPAFAEASVKGGDYVMVAGAYESSTDFIYVMDVASQRMNVYFANAQRKEVELIQSVDIAQAFGE